MDAQSAFYYLSLAPRVLSCGKVFTVKNKKPLKTFKPCLFCRTWRNTKQDCLGNLALAKNLDEVKTDLTVATLLYAHDMLCTGESIIPQVFPLIDFEAGQRLMSLLFTPEKHIKRLYADHGCYGDAYEAKMKYRKHYAGVISDAIKQYKKMKKKVKPRKPMKTIAKPIVKQVKPRRPVVEKPDRKKQRFKTIEEEQAWLDSID